MARLILISAPKLMLIITDLCIIHNYSVNSFADKFHYMSCLQAVRLGLNCDIKDHLSGGLMCKLHQTKRNCAESQTSESQFWLPGIVNYCPQLMHGSPTLASEWGWKQAPAELSQQKIYSKNIWHEKRMDPWLLWWCLTRRCSG